jgi:SRSO17 transposase
MTPRQIKGLRAQLNEYVEGFGAEQGRGERRHGCGKYLEGLMLEGERKSTGPLAERVGGDEQAMRQFVNQSPWEHEAAQWRLRERMRGKARSTGVLVLDDTSLPKQGRHSAGVARQYCGALGKIANCQSGEQAMGLPARALAAGSAMVFAGAMERGQDADGQSGSAGRQAAFSGKMAHRAGTALRNETATARV